MEKPFQMPIAKTILICLLLFIAGASLHAQYEDSEKLAFVKSYLEKKAISTDPLTKDSEALIQKSAVTPERFQEIFRKKLIGEEFTLSERETNLLIELEKLRNIQAHQEEKAFQEILKNNKISVLRYQEILRKYQSDIKFQRSLHDLFIQEMQLGR